MQNRTSPSVSPRHVARTSSEFAATPPRINPTNVEFPPASRETGELTPPGSPQRGRIPMNLQQAYGQIGPSQTPVSAAMAETSKTSVGPQRDFLENTMGRADLADLADLFNKETQQWAFIGSVAMQIHGHDLNSETAKNWQPGDADVLTNQHGRLRICEKPVPAANPDEPARCRGTTFNFTDTLKVDVVAASRTDKRFRGLETDTVYIKSTPVLSIAALIRLKESALQFAQSGSAPDVIKRGEDNLATLKELQELSDARRSQASPGNVDGQSETPSESSVAQGSSSVPDDLSTVRPSARAARRLAFS